MTPDLTRAVWRKSTKSQDNGGCVEVATFPECVAIRDAKNPDGPMLIFSNEQWNAFLIGAVAGEFTQR